MENIKKIAMISIALLLFPAIAYAIYGGETVSYNFTSCQNLIVNITNTQMNEWSASPNCTEETAGNFNCNCSDNWTLNLTPAVNSVGTFTISVTDYYSQSVQTQTTTIFVPSAGGGGSSFGFGNIILSTTATTHPTTNTVTVTQTVAPPTTTSTPITTTPTGANPVSAITGFFALPTTQYSIIFIILALIISYVLYRYFTKPSKGSEMDESRSENSGPTGIRTPSLFVANEAIYR